MIQPRVPDTTPTHYPLCAARAMAPLLGGILALLISAAQVRGAEIVVVTSGDASPYVQADNGATELLEQAKHHVRTVALADLTSQGLDATMGPSADAVVAVGTPAATWLHKQLPPNKPLVFCLVADPTAAGLTQGRKTYGVTTEVPLTQQFALLAQAIPQARTIGMLYRSDTAEGKRLLAAVKDALPKDWSLSPVAVDQCVSVAQAIEELTQQHVDAIWTSSDPSTYDTAGVRALLLTSLRKRIPVFGFSSSFVRAGALLGISVDPKTQGSQAADILQRLLKNPADPNLLQVAPAQSCQLVLNLIVADKLGIQLPDTFVQKASKTFQQDK